MKLDSRTGFAVLIISGIIIIPLTVIINETKTEPFNMEIQEIAAFDPVCLRTERENSTDVTCQNQSDWWFVEQGLSTNFEFADAPYNSKSLFVKVDLSKIPISNLLTRVTINKSDLIVGALYQSINMTEEPNERFVVTYGLCDDIDWNNKMNPTKLPCFDNDGRPVIDADLFQGVLKPERINKLNFDIKSHVDKVRNDNRQTFTEIITFASGSFLNNNDYKNTIQTCLKNSISESNKNDCIKRHQITVYGSKFPLSGFKPKVLGEYKKEPTVLSQTLSNIVFTVFPIIASFLIYVHNQERDYNKKMLKVCGALREDVKDTLNAINDRRTVGRNFSRYQLYYDNINPPLVLNLPKEVTNVYFSTAAYQSMLNSGILENFDEEHQILISTLYEHIIRYNESIELFHKSIDDFRIDAAKFKSASKVSWAYEETFMKYLTYLGNTREKIKNRITDQNNGVLSILKKEEAKFGKTT